MANEVFKRVDDFIINWTDCTAKNGFLGLKELIFGFKDVEIDFIERKGISYSLRAKHKNQTTRKLFVMVDVIDDEPDNRWLSVCFYGDMISDPDEKGDLIPGGLLGEDGYCFDVEKFSEEEVNYIKERIKEAYKNAAN
ncbi:hypothetical protein JCM13304A_05810 [Desulfothermus okinawensis JCM 13304]